ncbi:hypothetical protein KHF85_18085 [Xanthomonas translucens pv. graminis]|uniref:hypothetical protein n=1 Tax=Xanthomonas graminis TaxID=3390026 RepID=UPI0025412FAA|nr:hypothetical protein [Xanthomonas translucens]WIH04654.1 hypothetical protein KHF85_18085 [Xanthomonas translucens pv. graminis]
MADSGIPACPQTAARDHGSGGESGLRSPGKRGTPPDRSNHGVAESTIARQKKARLQRTASGPCSLPHVGMQVDLGRFFYALHAALQNETGRYILLRRSVRRGLVFTRCAMPTRPRRATCHRRSIHAAGDRAIGRG